MNNANVVVRVAVRCALIVTLAAVVTWAVTTAHFFGDGAGKVEWLATWFMEVASGNMGGGISQVIQSGLLPWLGIAFALALGAGALLMLSGIRELREGERAAKRLESSHGYPHESRAAATEVDVEMRRNAALLQEAAAAIVSLEKKVRALDEVTAAIRNAGGPSPKTTLPADARSAEWPANVAWLPVRKAQTTRSYASDCGLEPGGAR